MKANVIARVLIVVAVFSFGFVALAQTQVQSSENAALTQTLQNQQQPQIEVVNDPITVPAQPTAQIAVPVQTTAPSQAQNVSATANVQQPVILQNRPLNTIQQPTLVIQKQPTTVVEDSPLTESAADRLRKQRMEIEQQTESKIVEKLEQERIKAEQDRANKLISALDGKKDEEKKDDSASTAAAAAAATTVVAPAPVEEVKQQAIVTPAVPAAQSTVVNQQADQINNTPAVEVKAELNKLDSEEKKLDKMYFGFDLGYVSYPTVENVNTSAGVGATLGYIFDQRYIVEGNFLFNRAEIEDVYRAGVCDPYYGVCFPTYENMDQYSLGGTFKYKILSSRFSPYIGGSLAYVYRRYDDKQSFDGPYNLSGSSWAFDMGLLAGAGIDLSEHFTLGFDFKYYFNVAYDVNMNGRLEPSKIMYENLDGKPIEALNRYNFLVNLKYVF